MSNFAYKNNREPWLHELACLCVFTQKNLGISDRVNGENFHATELDPNLQTTALQSQSFPWFVNSVSCRATGDLSTTIYSSNSDINRFWVRFSVQICGSIFELYNRLRLSNKDLMQSGAKWFLRICVTCLAIASWLLWNDRRTLDILMFLFQFMTNQQSWWSCCKFLWVKLHSVLRSKNISLMHRRWKETWCWLMIFVLLEKLAKDVKKIFSFFPYCRKRKQNW